MSAGCARILLVDDDPDILRILKDNLELDGYMVVAAGTGKEALRAFDNWGASLVVLDLSLPDVDGIQVCRLIRERSSVPIIILTARDRIPDKVLGLDSGADDYMVKPFDYLELAARIKACLRRSLHALDDSEIIDIGDLKIDTARASVWKRGRKVDLTVREFNLLLLLAKNSGKAMNRTAIRNAIWPNRELYRDSRAIDVHLQHLRAKLEDNPSEPRYLVTVQGVGYMMALPEA